MNEYNPIFLDTYRRNERDLTATNISYMVMDERVTAISREKHRTHRTQRRDDGCGYSSSSTSNDIGRMPDVTEEILFLRRPLESRGCQREFGWRSSMRATTNRTTSSDPICGSWLSKAEPRRYCRLIQVQSPP